MTTQITHTTGEIAPLLKQGWQYLCQGHNDVRCTGGTWLYQGNRAEAARMAAERTAALIESIDNTAHYWS